jgi:ribosomal protein S18 acetylase RimI-like enzyme
MPTHLRLATPADDALLRHLLRSNPMPGSISLTFEREPSYFAAAGVDGPFSQTLIHLDDQSGTCLGMGARIIRPLFLNGQVTEVGAMSHLRANRQWGFGMTLTRQMVRSFQQFHELHRDGRVPFYLMSVIADNAPARRLLTAQLPGMPTARAYTRMSTMAIAPRRARPALALGGGLRLERGGAEYVSEISACLQRNAARRQFSPYWCSENLFTPGQTPNLQPEDFFVVCAGSRVVGCLALWDQTPFKQSVVRGYQGGMRRWRPLINVLARVIDLPSLPAVDTPMRYGYASHLAVDQDDRRVFFALLRALYNETARRGFNYFVLGLAESDPLRPIVTRGYFHITYSSQIYLMAWEDGLDALAQVDRRPPGLEIAVL